jgi:hypothetical protein
MSFILSKNSILKSINGELGEDDYKEPLETLLTSFKQEAKLSLLGKIAVRYQLSNHLQTRANVFKMSKSLDSKKVSQPIFVMGLPRSGTTFLFNLLSQDKDHRSPLFWEMYNPIPLVSEGSVAHKIRILKTKLILFAKAIIMPGVSSVHSIDADSPEECLLIKTLSLRSLIYLYMADLPSYQSYLQTCDYSPAFIWHKRFLNCLETQNKPKRWLLKDPCHIECLEEIKKIYPDACFINIHRDPSKTIPSICSLTEKVRVGFSREIDKKAIGVSSLSFWKNANNKFNSSRSPSDDVNIVDVNFEDFIKDPLRSVKSIYSHFGFDLDIETETNMIDFVSISQNESKEPHVYTPEEFGLSSAGILEALSFNK